jgi:MFS transporter, ACS family, D-galactonate transporter
VSTPAERPSQVRYYVLAALLVITAINYVQRNCISPLATTMEEALGIKQEHLDDAIAAFFWLYTLFQVPSGWLAQRWGPRLTLPLYAAGWSAALAVAGLAGGYGQLLLGRSLMGALQAGIFPCATLILASWFPPSQRGLASALLNSCMLLGGAASVLIATELRAPLGWDGVFLAFSVPGVVWAAWFYWWFRNRPEDHAGVNQAELDLLAKDRPAPKPAVKRSAIATLVLLATSLPLILLCTQQFFRAAVNRLYDSRLPTYLEKQRITPDMLSVSRVEVEERGPEKAEDDARKKLAGRLASFPYWVGIIGGPVGGWLSDYLLRRTGSRRIGRNGVAIGSLAVAMLLYLAAYQVADVRVAILVMSAGFFVFSFSSPCAYALSIDIGGKNLAVVFGLMNMFGNLGAAAYVSSIMRTVAVGGWELALGTWFVMHGLALVCWCFLDPNVVIGETPSKE